MDVQDAISKILNEVDGVVDAVVFEKEIADRVMNEESTIRSMAGPEVKNKAYTETHARDERICIFCNKKIIKSEETSLTLEDPEGNIMGMILSRSKIPEYMERTDVFWVSEDFIIFPDVVSKGGEAFVLKPLSFPVLSEDDGCYDVVLSVPASSSDIMIKNYYGVSLKENLSTMIVGYNHRKRITP